MENNTEIKNEENEFLDNWEGEREQKTPAPETTAKPVNQAAPEPPKVKSKLPPDLSSEILIGAIDTTQSLVFNAILKKKIRNRYSGEQIAKAEKLIQQIADKEINKKDLSDPDYDLVYEYKRLMELHEDIPFTDEEYNTLKKPLAQLIEINGYDIPPGIAMAIAAAQVMAPRLIDAFFE